MGTEPLGTEHLLWLLQSTIGTIYHITFDHLHPQFVQKQTQNSLIMYYYLYQAIWPINKSVYLILSGKSTRM